MELRGWDRKICALFSDYLFDPVTIVLYPCCLPVDLGVEKDQSRPSLLLEIPYLWNICYYFSSLKFFDIYVI